MINIIENTMIDPIKMKCGLCMSTFTYNFEDIKTDEDSPFSLNLGFGKRYRRYVQCPVCKVRNVLSDVHGTDDKENTCES